MSSAATAPAPEVRVFDAEELARVAAEAVALIEHHRAELEATMAELTALQRAVRSELRSTIAEVRELADRLDPAGATAPSGR
ncbi:MAG: hypothetical protein ACKO5A_08700 [Actinomycetota bacterium]